MGGSIHYRDGRKLAIWNLGYEYIYLRVEFEPIPKMPQPRWRIG